MFKNLQKKRDEGFTIIEVLIVLAIAGLILLIVLIAVPQLQKNQRNEARRSVLSRISTEVSNFTGNNQGVLPVNGGAVGDDDNFIGGFRNRYLDDGAGNVANTFLMPDGTAADLIDYTGQAIVEDDIYYNAGATCAGELPSGAGGDRDFAIAIGLEGGASYCVDNGSN